MMAYEELRVTSIGRLLAGAVASTSQLVSSASFRFCRQAGCERLHKIAVTFTILSLSAARAV